MHASFRVLAFLKEWVQTIPSMLGTLRSPNDTISNSVALSSSLAPSLSAALSPLVSSLLMPIPPTHLMVGIVWFGVRGFPTIGIVATENEPRIHSAHCSSWC